jgi:hypothetical protein
MIVWDFLYLNKNNWWRDTITKTQRTKQRERVGEKADEE